MTIDRNIISCADKCLCKCISSSPEKKRVELCIRNWISIQQTYRECGGHMKQKSIEKIKSVERTEH